jgi:predicted MPP superfamily phosphohydrolase
MKTTTILIAVSIVTLIYSLANYYIYSRGLLAFSINSTVKTVYAITLWVAAASFIAGMFLERLASSVFSEWVFRIGSLWLAFMLYFFIATILFDLTRLVFWIVGFHPVFSSGQKFWIGISVVSLVTVVVIAGHINALWVNVKEIPLEIHKTVAGKKEFKVLMASDIHLGALMGERREKVLLNIVKKQSPDLVLICGDLIDSEIAPVLRKNLGRHIQEIEAPMGVYAVTGNHEYIGGIEKSLEYLKSINIRVLKDEVVTLPNGIQVVGRNDRSAGGFGANRQKPLAELLSGIDHNKPIIVMNHQPYSLGEAEKESVDLHLSGHTHNGQLWPLNYVTRAIFEVSWGYLKKGNSHFYVSSGFGTWGPSVRTGNRPEVVVFDLKFD